MFMAVTAAQIKHDHYMFAKEALTKAEDFENLISLHVKKSRLPDKPMKAVADVARQVGGSVPAGSITSRAGRRDLPTLGQLVDQQRQVVLLSKPSSGTHCRYEEAYEAFEKAGRSDLSSDMLRQLTNLSAEQKLFKQAGMYS